MTTASRPQTTRNKFTSGDLWSVVGGLDKMQKLTYINVSEALNLKLHSQINKTTYTFDHIKPSL